MWLIFFKLAFTEVGYFKRLCNQWEHLNFKILNGFEVDKDLINNIRENGEQILFNTPYYKNVDQGVPSNKISSFLDSWFAIWRRPISSWDSTSDSWPSLMLQHWASSGVMPSLGSSQRVVR